MEKKRNLMSLVTILVFFVAMLSGGTAGGKIIYVDADAGGANDGSSWANACNYLQLALYFAQYGYGDEVRVAQGVYKPVYGTDSDRETSFQLIGGVTIKGGYAGFGEPDPNARDIKAYETILSGDFAGDDVEVLNPQDLLDEPTRADNSYHVVTFGTYGYYHDGPPVLDGLTITGGNANGAYRNNCGGGIYIYHEDVIITDCIFINNSAAGGTWEGGGGAMAFQNSRVIFTRCSFIRNATGLDGGAVCMDGCGTCRDSYAEFKDCRFINNYAGSNGGALYTCINTLTNLLNCIIAGNTAGGSGGGLFDDDADHSSLVNCTFTGNVAQNGGGVLSYKLWTRETLLTNCILWDNYSDEISGGGANVTYSDIGGGWPGIGNIDADPCFISLGYWADKNDPNIVVEPNEPNAVWIDGDYHLLPGSPCINTGDPNYIAEPSTGQIPTGHYFYSRDPNYIAKSSEKDLDGKPRVIGSRVDMGAYECGGSGTADDPYLIYDANQMNAIGADSNDWDKHFLLCADIDLSGFTGTSFNIIGYYVSWDNNKPFTGVFDGNGHIISNFTYNSTGTHIGLFGYVRGENAEIKNLGLIDPDVDAGIRDGVGSLVGLLHDGTVTNCYVEGGSVSGNRYVGGLVGRNWEGTITNCYSTGSVSGSGWDVGGLVGFNYYGTITNCYATGSVSGNSSVGGLVASNSYGTITNSYATGSVSGDRSVGGLVGSNSDTITNCYSTGGVSGTTNVGGLVGYNDEDATINACYSTGNVDGDEFVGGLVGKNWWATITSCYSTGSVSGNERIGGLVGFNYESTVMASFWDIETSGQTSSAGGTGLPTTEMQMQVTFMDAGWDFVGERINGSEDIWMMTCEGMSYPKLSWWQPVLGDYFCPDGVDMIDMEHLALHWLDTGCDETNDYCDRAEISNDSTIDFTDFAILAGNWLAGR